MMVNLPGVTRFQLDCVEADGQLLPVVVEVEVVPQLARASMATVQVRAKPMLPRQIIRARAVSESMMSPRRERSIARIERQRGETAYEMSGQARMLGDTGEPPLASA
jgi:hypothetical protein